MQPGDDAMKQLNFNRLQTRYSGQFIALWRGKVIASAATNAALLKKVRPVFPTKRIELMWVPPKGIACLLNSH
jgi:hypothetical protein